MRKIIVYIIILFQLAVTYSLSRSLYQSINSRSRVDDLRYKKLTLEEEKIELSEKLNHVNSDYYIEEVARETLHLSKPGETVVILDSEQLNKVMGVEDSQEEVEMSIWMKWLEIINFRNW